MFEKQVVKLGIKKRGWVTLGSWQTLVILCSIEALCPIVGSHKTEGKISELSGRNRFGAFWERRAKWVGSLADLSIQDLMLNSFKNQQPRWQSVSHWWIILESATELNVDLHNIVRKGLSSQYNIRAATVYVIWTCVSPTHQSDRRFLRPIYLQADVLKQTLHWAPSKNYILDVEANIKKRKV